MSEPWFRMHANVLDKPVVWRLVKATGIHPARAAGHLAAFWGKVSQHGSGGRVADLPDAQLEAWAGWDGKRGAFAAWLRAEHVTDGVVNEYEEYSGALEMHRAKSRARVQKWRANREQNAHGDADVTRTEAVTDASRNDVTLRYDTKREVQEQQQLPPAVQNRRTADPDERPGREASARRREAKSPKYPHYPVERCQALHAAWQQEMGVVDYAAFRKRTAPAFLPSGLAHGAADEVLRETVELYAMRRENAGEAHRRFYTLQGWLDDLPNLLRLAAMPMTEGSLPTEKARLVLGVG